MRVAPLFFIPLLACAEPRQVTGQSPELAAIVEAENSLALDLMAALPQEENLFFSPFSIYSALGMTYAGAAGQTREEMKDTLHVPVDDAVFHREFGALSRDLAGQHHRPYTLLSGNRLWGQEGLNWEPAMLETCAGDYDAELTEVDFAGDSEGARAKINRWVSRSTDGKISEALGQGSVTQDTRIILSNASYFHADWALPFEPSDTVPTDFLLADGEPVSVPMMNVEAQAGLYVDESVSVLRLPYEGEELSLLVILPAEIDGLAALEDELSPAQISTWVDGMGGLSSVRVSLPRFSIRSRFDLAQTLSDLGMPSAFTPGLADFSGMTPDADLSLGSVEHQALIEVDEQGTTAVAFTAVMAIDYALINGNSFVADHGFVFAIRDDLSGALLFVGRLVQPIEG